MADDGQYLDELAEGEEGEEGDEEQMFEDAFDGDVPSLDPNDVRETPKSFTLFFRRRRELGWAPKGPAHS